MKINLHKKELWHNIRWFFWFPIFVACSIECKFPCSIAKNNSFPKFSNSLFQSVWMTSKQHILCYGDGCEAWKPWDIWSPKFEFIHQQNLYLDPESCKFIKREIFWNTLCRHGLKNHLICLDTQFWLRNLFLQV